MNDNKTIGLRIRGNASQLENGKWIFFGFITNDGRPLVDMAPKKLFESKEECLKEVRIEVKVVENILKSETEFMNKFDGFKSFSLVFEKKD